ncbi:MaoC family dehydratase N-terminal domain-containing protein [Oceanobacillus sp. CFH 90083]|uniref:FAS1-like dehydratase domain-containing protein n=1 Tax=Oceanobacillus sp. CFH 90083 TaxID=2592336 RepID=UPI001883746D|nr:MaoC family dehydratase N-terminal domain-containing protein [Oceanobacillus sp. CFH 90083]
MIDKKWIGTTTEWISTKVTRKEVQEFCTVIGEENLLYQNITVAKEAGYADIPLPPTYPILFWQSIELPWLTDDFTMLQSDQSFSYEHTLIANKTYHCQIQLQKLRTQSNQQFIVHRLSIDDGDGLAATSDTTMVLRYQEE